MNDTESELDDTVLIFNCVARMFEQFITEADKYFIEALYIDTFPIDALASILELLDTVSI